MTVPDPHALAGLPEPVRARVVAQLAVGVDALELPARVVEVEPLEAARRVVHRFGKGGEIRAAARQGAIVGGRVFALLRRFPSREGAMIPAAPSTNFPICQRLWHE